MGVKSEEGSCDCMVDEDDDQEKIVEETLGGWLTLISIVYGKLL